MTWITDSAASERMAADPVREYAVTFPTRMTVPVQNDRRMANRRSLARRVVERGGVAGAIETVAARRRPRKPYPTPGFGIHATLELWVFCRFAGTGGSAPEAGPSQCGEGSARAPIGVFAYPHG